MGDLYKMSKFKKYIKKSIVIIIILITIITTYEIAIRIRLNYSGESVSKALFSNSYFIKAEDNESKIECFKNYMFKDGWSFLENYDEKIIFRKGNLQKEVPIKDLINI